MQEQQQRHTIFHSNADVKILKIFLACTREHKKKRNFWNSCAELHCSPIFHDVYDTCDPRVFMNLNI